MLRAFDGIISYYDEASRHDNDKPDHRFATGDIYLNRKWQPILVDQVQEYASRMAKVGCLSGDATFYMEAAVCIAPLCLARSDHRIVVACARLVRLKVSPQRSGDEDMPGCFVA